MLVRAAASDVTFAWMTDRLGPLWSPELAGEYELTRQRLRFPDRADIENVEAGLWRVRLDGLVRERPAVAAPLAAVIAEVRWTQAQALSWDR